MDFFSRHKDESASAEPSRVIPTDILAAVSVMRADGLLTDKQVKQQTAARPLGASPFLGEGVSEERRADQVSGTKGSVIPRSLGELRTTPAPEEGWLARVRTLDRKKVLIVGIGGLLLLILLGSTLTWYFLRPKPQIIEAPVVSFAPVTPQEPTPTPASPYAADTANYLPLDTETITADSFREQIGHIGEQIVAVQMAKPVEFLLTDKNNNPLAFSRFAYLMKLDMSEELLAVFGESFSFFVFNDGGKARFGLGLTWAEPVVAKKLIAQNEKTLPFLLRPILYGDITVPREVSFRGGVYDTELVRFVNMDASQNISFDFVVRERGLFLGTSKETLRAILDKKRP